MKWNMGLNSYLKTYGIIATKCATTKIWENSSNDNCVAMKLTGIRLDQYISTEMCLN